MLAAAFAAFALAAQPPQDDGPVQTAPKEHPASELPAAPARTPPPRQTPSAQAAPREFTFDPKTYVDGESLQVVLGQRAIFRLDSKNLPVLEAAEDGQLAAAHPDGEVTERFEPPGDGLIAIALDGSAEKRATLLKIWNSTGKPVQFKSLALVLRQGKVIGMPTPAVCTVPAHGVHTESWPRPVVAVALLDFKPTAANSKTCE